MITTMNYDIQKHNIVVFDSFNLLSTKPSSYEDIKHFPMFSFQSEIEFSEDQIEGETALHSYNTPPPSGGSYWDHVCIRELSLDALCQGC